MSEFDKPYDPKAVEPEIYAKWEKSGYFNPDNLPDERTKTYTMAIPPPNVTGTLHMGHALNAAIQDILIRKKRMEGYKALWIVGTDHAGIATQNVVERELKKEGKTRHDLGREEFLKRVWAWKEKYGDIILDQLKKLGASCDWSRARFTMDAQYVRAVEAAFLHYQKKGWIYQGERTINWCPRCATSLSDLEIQYQREQGKFYYIKYGPLVLGTARPETKLGDTALAVNPKDKRYRQYVGEEIEIQSVDPALARDKEPKLKTIKIKVIADEAADPKFGTGVIKVTPAHDIADFEIWQRHPEVPIRRVIGRDGRMSGEAGPRYQGLKVLEARKQIVEDMQKLGLMEKIEDYEHNVALCSRCGTVIEPMLSKQWFLKMEELAKLAIRDVKKGKVRFRPKRWEKIYFDWLKHIKDWCISRQIWWGHKIPIDGVDDVLDTWFSSALWPFATLGWPEKTRDLETYYPTQVLSTARDIVNLWVARMVFSSEELLQKPPFSDVIIHATVLAKSGKRMSKSLGTGVDPMDLIEKYGADATRFGLVWQAMGTQDIKWAEEHVAAGRKFLNKIWNASRFVLGRIQNSNSEISYSAEVRLRRTKAGQNPKPKTAADKKILVALKKTKKEVDASVEKYEFGKALRVLYDFFWHQLCDVYLEASKNELNPALLSYVLAESLKLLHPFLPHITEKIWEELPPPAGGKNKKLLMIESWPKS
ncbi:valine--tRNA ligase [Candidatus Giovannonibacteria bacterium]|nr:valine--tRNA ligase [Candidatus Giovannonibacteria bacterium]